MGVEAGQLQPVFCLASGPAVIPKQRTRRPLPLVCSRWFRGIGHMRSGGQSVAGRTPGESRMNNKQASYQNTQLATMDITADHMKHVKF